MDRNSRNGLDRFDPEILTSRTTSGNRPSPASLSANDINSVYVDRRNTVWVGTSSGLDRFDRGPNHLFITVLKQIIPTV